jgi:IS605 OrfB family transposase
LERVKYYGEDPNFQNLRDTVVTGDTKKQTEAYKAYNTELQRLKYKLQNVSGKAKEDLEIIIKSEEQEMRDAMKEINYRKNMLVTDWELSFSKEVRSNAVNKVCESYKTATANLKAGNIKSFDISFMKKNSRRKCVEFSSSQINFRNNRIVITCFKEHSEFKISTKMIKKLKKHDIVPETNCDLVYVKGSYFLMVPVKIEPEEFNNETERYCSVDPGLVKFATTFGNTGVYEYKHNRELLKRLNAKIKSLKDARTRKFDYKKRTRKRHLKKIDYTDQLHWRFINNILSNHDVVFFGDIKSHDIVNKGSNKTLNQEFNDIKFYRLKQRMKYKATLLGKKVIYINEFLTTKTCSCCGKINEPENSRVYDCKYCGEISDRDINSAKNILLKGMIQNQIV